MNVLPTYISAPHICLVPVEVRKEHWVLWNGLTGGYEPSCRSWELNPGSLQEQPMLFAAEPSLLFLNQDFWSVLCHEPFRQLAKASRWLPRIYRLKVDEISFIRWLRTPFC